MTSLLLAIWLKNKNGHFCQLKFNYDQTDLYFLPEKFLFPVKLALFTGKKILFPSSCAPSSVS